MTFRPIINTETNQFISGYHHNQIYIFVKDLTYEGIKTVIYHQINVLAVKFGCYFVGTALLLGTRALIHAGVPLEIINHEYLLTPPTILKGSYKENQEYRILVQKRNMQNENGKYK